MERRLGTSNYEVQSLLATEKTKEPFFMEYELGGKITEDLLVYDQKCILKKKTMIKKINK